MKRKLEIVVLSDVHLGIPSCRARDLIRYLRQIDPKTVILNGDFIDKSHLKNPDLPSHHKQVIREIIRMAQSGSRIFYITGNHDKNLDAFAEIQKSSIQVRSELLLCYNKKQYWVCHGDKLMRSSSPTFWKSLSWHGYRSLTLLARWLDTNRAKKGKTPTSFIHRVRNIFGKGSSYINMFEKMAIRQGEEKGYDFIICGHIHSPNIIHQISGCTYLNAGDWIENFSALEYNFGKWSIYKFDEMDFKVVNPRLKVNKGKEIENYSPSLNNWKEWVSSPLSLRSATRINS